MSTSSTKVLDALRNQLLRDPEAHWRTLTNYSEHQIMLVDAAGTILFANRPLPSMARDLTGKSLYNQLPEAQAEQFYQVIENVLNSGQPGQLEFCLSDSNKPNHYFDTRIYPVKEDDKVTALIVDSRDISVHVTQQSKLERNHALLNTVLSNSPIILWAFDDKGVFTLSEGKGLEALGLASGEVVGQSVFDVYKNFPDILNASETSLNGESVTIVVEVNGRVYQTFFNPILNAQSEVTSVIGVANDITDLARSEKQMRILSSALEQTAEMVMITDVDGVIEYVNPAFEVITGYSREEVLGKKPALLRSGKMDAQIYHNLWETVLHGDSFSEVFINKRKDDSIFYEEKTITPVLGTDKKITHFVATGKDISERMRTQERLHYMAHHDALTNLPNRTLFLDRLRQAMARARWHNRLIAVMFIDIDHFKAINDDFGYSVGDQLLIQLSKRFSSSTRAGDTIARFGGDEFAILLDDIASEKDVSLLAKKLLDTLAPEFVVAEQRVLITASIGVSIFPNDGDDEESLLRNADVAMYRAKDLGRNNYQFFSNEMSARAFERLSLENSLRHALKRQEFFLLYQPQVDLSSGTIIGVEALLRWQHPDLGIIMPTEFVALLEETGLIVPVGSWVLKTACRQAVAWHQAGFKQLTMSVNLSGRQFNNPDIIKSFSEIIAESGIDPTLLEMELTESMLMRNASKTISALNSLHHLGIQIAVDDFGTGYSSLNYLRRFPISTLKIDRSFIRDVVDDADDAAIATAIIVMAQSLNLRVVAEGVETDAQKAFLQERNCQLIQGDWFSVPVDAESITQMLGTPPTVLAS